MTKLELPNYFISPFNSVPKVLVHYFESDAYSDKTKITLNANLISFLFEGSKELYHNNLSATIAQHQFVLAKSGNCLMSERLSESQKYSSLLFFFTEDFVTEFENKHCINQEGNKLSMAVESPFIVLQYDDFIQNFVISLQHLIKWNPDTSKEFLHLKLEEILLYLVQKFGGVILNFFKSADFKPTGQKLRLQNIVENNICSKLTLEELAFLCHMSLSTFKREFAKIYGVPPSKWIQAQRLQKSTQLLLQNKERPSDIYHVVGYESLSSFTQSFKQKYGITPKQFQLQQI